MSNVCEGIDGKLFRSAKELCQAYDLPYAFYQYNKSKGYAIDRIVEIYNKGRVQDHKGNFFKNYQAMCNYYNIELSLFRKRIKSGWSLEDALTKTKQHDYIDTRPKKFIMQDGTEYKSHSEVSRKHGIANSTLAQRLEKGMSVDDAINKPIRKRNNV